MYRKWCLKLTLSILDWLLPSNHWLTQHADEYVRQPIVMPHRIWARVQIVLALHHYSIAHTNIRKPQNLVVISHKHLKKVMKLGFFSIVCEYDFFSHRKQRTLKQAILNLKFLEPKITLFCTFVESKCLPCHPYITLQK